MHPKNFAEHLTSLAAFLLPGLALWIRSGPSYGAALLLIGTLVFIPRWIKVRPAPGTWALAAVLLCMAILWYELTTQQDIQRLDRPVKWALGALCLFYAAANPPRASSFFWGLPIGCIGMGFLALWQIYGQGMWRATGYTNAIPWGDTALLLACFTGVHTVIFWRERLLPWRLLHVVAIVAGLSASMLSQSRGGWLALVLAIPLLVLVAWRLHADFLPKLLMLLGGVVLVFALTIFSVPHLRAHANKAVHEITQYFQSNEVNTSLGIRLEQYRMAFDLIPEKPLLGWSRQGFEQETERRVATGLYHPALLGYRDYIHNELLDSWVKTGVLGAMVQLALYFVPLWLFWPSSRRMSSVLPIEKWRQVLSLRLMGCLMSVMHLGFGMTMPYFAHNSGTVFFIFCMVCLWAALQGLEKANHDEVRA
ncbi:O-antigen ligase family protein [Comamonas sp. Y33R10-2]|uniref:O-antigen ligase family protein n=1 Tax=Comamonas sp. Y33R10-2 TaxID=2853257 RepID=UPI001C5CAD2E|nr:O-antigen ligase family protein [Comamonas sp. Y33R10-2]QXZ08802.1 O-antigen ligase family protein [Comamonas sp. Y33R10-2]